MVDFEKRTHIVAEKKQRVIAQKYKNRNNKN
jgi:hypothetical protein